MRKEVQMSIKMESELRDQFVAVAASNHRPAAQIVRELMRLYIAQQQRPNQVTIAAMNELEQGKGMRFASVDELFKDLEI
ncbi:MAG: addiction module antitoxin [Methylotenera sp.]|nr:addiction module antitoxin [Methylotenera sp.]